MKQIVADKTLATKLAELNEPVEIVTPSGEVLGVFEPNPDYRVVTQPPPGGR